MKEKNKWAIITYFGGEEDIIQADEAELDKENNLVIFILDNKLVATYNMESIIGWSFDDSGKYDFYLEDEKECAGCPESYVKGITHCWELFKKLADNITVPKIKLEIKQFLNENDPVDTVLDYMYGEDDE